MEPFKFQKFWLREMSTKNITWDIYTATLKHWRFESLIHTGCWFTSHKSLKTLLICSHIYIKHVKTLPADHWTSSVDTVSVILPKTEFGWNFIFFFKYNFRLWKWWSSIIDGDFYPVSLNICVMEKTFTTRFWFLCCSVRRTKGWKMTC